MADCSLLIAHRKKYFFAKPNPIFEAKMTKKGLQNPINFLQNRVILLQNIAISHQK
jgi:hypothetical protein